MTTSEQIENLLLQIGEGDQSALSRLFELTGSQLFGYLIQTLESRVQAESALEATFLEVWKTADQFDGDDIGPMEWLIWVARKTSNITEVDDDEIDTLVPVVPPRHIKIRLKSQLTTPMITEPTVKRRPKKKLSWARFLLGVMVALLIAAALIIMNPPAPTPERAITHIAMIASDDNSLVVAVTYDQTAGELIATAEEGGPSEDQTLEMWLIADGAMAPISIGTLASTDSTTLIVPESIRSWVEGGILAINETTTNNTTDSPNPMIAAGTVVAQ